MEDRLQKFARLVELGSFTKAAAELHVSQPALSAAIQKLERELKAELLRRGAHVFAVTPAGRLAYKAGKELARRDAQLREQLAVLAGEKVKVAIGMIDSIADLLFVHSGELDALERWARVSLSINNSSLLVRAVVEQTLDLAIIAEQPTLPKALTAEALGSEPLVTVARADIAALAIEAVHRGTLPVFLSYNQTSTTHQLVQTAAAQAGVALQPSFYSTSPEIIHQLVQAGRGTAALPYLMVRAELDEGSLRPIAIGASCVVERPIIAIQHPRRHLPPGIHETLHRTQTQLEKLLQHAQAL